MNCEIKWSLAKKVKNKQTIQLENILNGIIATKQNSLVSRRNQCVSFTVFFHKKKTNRALFWTAETNTNNNNNKISNQKLATTRVKNNLIKAKERHK